MTTARPHLTDEQLDSLGNELDELRNRIVADLGERDAAYIRKVIRADGVIVRHWWVAPTLPGTVHTVRPSRRRSKQP